MALETVATSGGVHRLPGMRRLILVTAQAKASDRCFGEYDASDIPAHPYLMTGGTSHTHGGMHVCPLGLVFVALKTDLRICLGIKRHRVFRRKHRHVEENHKQNRDVPGRLHSNLPNRHSGARAVPPGRRTTPFR